MRYFAPFAITFILLMLVLTLGGCAHYVAVPHCYIPTAENVETNKDLATYAIGLRTSLSSCNSTIDHYNAVNKAK